MRKNILFISHSGKLAGAELCLLDLIGGLNRKTLNPYVIIPHEGPLSNMARDLGAKVIISPVHWWVASGKRNRWHLQHTILDMPRRVGIIRKIIRSERIDLVYTNTITCIDGSIAARKEKLPHIWHIHEIPSSHLSIKFYTPKSILLKIMKRYSTKVIVPSLAAKKYFSLLGDDRLRVVRNGVDINRYLIGCDTYLRKELGIGSDAKIVCMIGQINENKGQTDFIAAVKIVSKNFPNTYFLIVGEGNEQYTNKIKRDILVNNLGDKVRLLGFRDDIINILFSIDISVSASKSECMPRVLIESMAAAKPVVSTMSGGPQEIVEHGRTGLLVPCANPRELAKAIMYLLGNEATAKKMGDNGRKRAQRLFAAEKYVSSIENLINECITSYRIQT